MNACVGDCCLGPHANHLTHVKSHCDLGGKAENGLKLVAKALTLDRRDMLQHRSKGTIDDTMGKSCEADMGIRLLVEAALLKLLVTRPLDDAGPLAEKLQGLGHEAIVMPLLAIKPKDAVLIPDLPFQALCTSSANGLLCTADLSAFFQLPFFAIGPQSAAAARQLGFTHVSDKGGNVEGLVQYICKHAKPENGPLLYLSGSETTGDLEGKLKSHGFNVSRVIVYDAVPETVADIGQQVVAAGATEAALQLTHYCLSANVAAQLPKGWVRRVSPAPDEFGMLSMLDRSGEAE
jgi:uroporphyrinogen-III synthase